MPESPKTFIDLTRNGLRGDGRALLPIQSVSTESHCRTGFRAAQELKSGTRVGLCVRSERGGNSQAATPSTMLNGRSVGTTRVN
jgi:hypothetical protein